MEAPISRSRPAQGSRSALPGAIDRSGWRQLRMERSLADHGIHDLRKSGRAQGRPGNAVRAGGIRAWEFRDHLRKPGAPGAGRIRPEDGRRALARTVFGASGNPTLDKRADSTMV